MISIHDKRNKKIGEYVVQFTHLHGNTDKKYVGQFTHLQGHSNKEPNLYMNDFFTIFKRSTISERNPTLKYDIWFEFKTKTEAINFISYCKTDFARMCLATLKVNQHLSSEMSMIPWMDFNETWNDKKLYKHFNISQQEQDFIKEVIPAYYD